MPEKVTPQSNSVEQNMPNSENEYFLLSEVVSSDGIVEKVHIGTAKRSVGAKDEWEFNFESIPMSGKVWTKKPTLRKGHEN